MAALTLAAEDPPAPRRNRFSTPWASGEIAFFFEKVFLYQKVGNDNEFQLPPPTELFSEYYQYPQLQELKKKLNDVKGKLNDYVLEDWSAHTRRRDPSGEVLWLIKNEIKAEFVTVAWCKFFECLQRFPLVKGPQFNSLHLCEAPGAFIAALNHFLHSKYKDEEVRWSWLASSMNPYHEANPLNKMITDDRFLFHTMDRWVFFEDYTGNIIKVANIEHLTQQCEERLQDVALITADGSVDCREEPNIQEESVSSLHFAEVVAALGILADGGCFVLKMFTLFEATSVSLVYLLNCAFEEVHLFKPVTSKHGNSEVYVVCLGYQRGTPHLSETLAAMKLQLEAKHTSPLFRRDQIPWKFHLQHEVCVRMFMNLQIEAIEGNIHSYHFPARGGRRDHNLLRSEVRKEFCNRYNIFPIPPEKAIVPNNRERIEMRMKSFLYKGSYSERQLLKVTSGEEQMFLLYRCLNDMDKMCSEMSREPYTETPSSSVVRTPLRVHSGQPVQVLNSSLFASADILAVREKLLAMYQTDPICRGTPKCSFDIDTSIPYVFNQSDGYGTTQQRFFVEVLNAVLQRRPLQIDFQNVLFLTHLSVSLLRVLADNVFKRLCIRKDREFCVTLAMDSSCDYDEEVLSTLRQLLEIVRGRALCLVDIASLHYNDFSCALMAHNDLLLLHHFRQMVKY